MTLTASRDILWEDILVIEPTIEPLDLEEVKKHRRYASTSLDTLFDMWIGSSRQKFEEATNLQLLTATRMFLAEAFPAKCRENVNGMIVLGRAPVRSIVSVEYVDADGTLQTMDAGDYEMYPHIPPKGSYASPGGVQLAEGAEWPSSVDRPGAVRVTYQAGFGDAPGAVPEVIVYALMQYVGDAHRWSENMTEKSATVLPIGTQMVVRNASSLMNSPRRMTRW